MARSLRPQLLKLPSAAAPALENSPLGHCLPKEQEPPASGIVKAARATCVWVASLSNLNVLAAQNRAAQDAVLRIAVKHAFIPVAGNRAPVAAIEVKITNIAGIAHTGRLAFTP